MKLPIEFIPRSKALKQDDFLDQYYPDSKYFLKIQISELAVVFVGISKDGSFQVSSPDVMGNDNITEDKDLGIAMEPLLKWIDSEGLASTDELEATRLYIKDQENTDGLE